MKLILCRYCHDVYKLTKLGVRTCACERTQGNYLPDGLHAEVSNNEYTVVLGFHNGTLVKALDQYNNDPVTEDGMGYNFTAFVIPDGVPTVKRIG